uniref:Uncharacterized protein n=1 Tax=Rhodnius prolixus TaxID=13249 RepID=T1HYF9_RHOPR
MDTFCFGVFSKFHFTILLGLVCAGDSPSFIVCAAFLGFVCAGDSPSFIVCAAFLGEILACQ